jgi:hypothetical protein
MSLFSFALSDFLSQHFSVTNPRFEKFPRIPPQWLYASVAIPA